MNKALFRTLLVPAITILVGIAGFAPASHAKAVFSIATHSLFTIDRADAVDINADSTVGGFARGSTSVSFTHTLSPDGVIPVEISAGIDGSARHPPSISELEAFYVGGHVIRIANPGPTDIEVPFSLSYDWTLKVSRARADEVALADALFSLSGFEAGIDAVDIDGDSFGFLTDTLFPAWSFAPDVFTDQNSVTEAGSEAITGKIRITAGSLGQFRVMTLEHGIASASSIPEPGSLPLLLSGLLAVGLLGWRAAGSRTSAREL